MGSPQPLPPGQDLPTGCLVTFRDVVNIRKYEFPEILICDPKTTGSGPTKHTVYKMSGKDHLGEFEGFRRYSHFNLFREILITRFPGLYIPPMPPKKKLVSYALSMLNRETKRVNLWKKECTFWTDL
jgi:PX domain